MMAVLEEDDRRSVTEIHVMGPTQNHCCHLRMLLVTGIFGSLSQQQTVGVLHSAQCEHYLAGGSLCSAFQWGCYLAGGKASQGQWVGQQSPR